MPEGAMRILFIDDEEDFLSSASTDLRLSLAEHKISCIIDTSTTVENGVQKLQNDNYHLAIVDLRFTSSTRDGNEIIGQILDTKILPIIVFSAYQNDLKTIYSQHGLIYNTRGKNVGEVVDKIVEWSNKNVFDFFSEDGFLNSRLRDVLQRTMWNHVSRYWEYIDAENPNVLHRIAGRIATTILYDVLVSTPANEEHGRELPVHHGEVYVFDTPRSHLAVGDVIELEEEVKSEEKVELQKRMFVVLSPTCDLVIRNYGGAKAKEVLLARCHELNTFISKNNTILDQVKTIRNPNKSDKQKQKASTRLEKLMRQDWENPAGRYFYLPPFGDFPGCVIDFLQVKVQPYNLEELREGRVVSLNREMAAELATRFARYMIRLGQPAYESNALLQAICNVVE